MTKIELEHLKTRINQNAREYALLDPVADKASRIVLYERLYLDISNYLKDAYLIMKIDYSYYGVMEVEEMYDRCMDKINKMLQQYDSHHCKEASFMTYMNRVFKNCIIDWAREVECHGNIMATTSLDEMLDPDENGGTNIEQNSSFQVQDVSQVEEQEARKQLLQHFSDFIIGFLAHRGKKYSDVKKLYFQIFYSESLINVIREEAGDDPESYPKHILDAFLFRFSDFVLSDICRTIYEIYHSGLHTYDDILHNGDQNPLKMPLSGKVMISYFAEVENKKVSDANISQYRKEYKTLIMADQWEE